MTNILFVTAGIPIAASEQGIKSKESLDFIKKIGLDGMELEFVHSIFLKPETAKIIGDNAKKLNLFLSCHGPYYLNLISKEQEKVEASKERILNCAKIINAAGFERVIYHPAYYSGFSEKEAYEKIKKEHQNLIDLIKKEKLKAILCPETTSHSKQFGTYTELAKLAQELGLENIWPCIDFAHIHARNNGLIKNEKDYQKIFDYLEKELGRKFVENMHIHFTGVDWQSGKDSHLTIDSKEPPFELLAKIMVAQGYGGVIVSESPNIEQDAMKMRDIYLKLVNKK